MNSIWTPHTRAINVRMFTTNMQIIYTSCLVCENSSMFQRSQVELIALPH